MKRCVQLGCGDAQALGKVRRRDNDAPSQPDALEVARADELVGGRAADTEGTARFLDGECEGMFGSHALLGHRAAQIFHRVLSRPDPAAKKCLGRSPSLEHCTCVPAYLKTVQNTTENTIVLRVVFVRPVLPRLNANRALLHLRCPRLQQHAGKSS